jgi:hypothetical protein
MSLEDIPDSSLIALQSMTDGNGTTTYAYVPVGSFDPCNCRPLANSAIAYTYDELGRLAPRTVAGVETESFGFDAIGRLIGHTSELGAFTRDNTTASLPRCLSQLPIVDIADRDRPPGKRAGEL